MIDLTTILKGLNHVNRALMLQYIISIKQCAEADNMFCSSADITHPPQHFSRKDLMPDALEEHDEKIV